MTNRRMATAALGLSRLLPGLPVRSQQRTVRLGWLLSTNLRRYRKFCGTAPQNLLMGLEAALQLIFHEGLEHVFTRHRQLASAVQAAVECWSDGGSVGFFGKVPGARSVSVTTIQTRNGVDPDALRAVARDRFQVAIAGGLGTLAGRAFRIGHLGDTNAATILGCLAGVEAAMAVQSIPYGRGGVEAAIARLATG